MKNPSIASGMMIALCMNMLTLPTKGVAQTPANGFANLIIEQQGETGGIYGEWTLIKPGNQTQKSSSAKESLENVIPGNYTIIVTPPQGATASTKAFVGGELVKDQSTPQITLTINPDDIVAVVITHSFVNVGIVAVNSDPGGIPFTLKGPNNVRYRDVTPASFEMAPEGQWSATFDELEGCATPPPMSDRLVAGSRINLSITIACENIDDLDLQQKKQKSLDYVTVFMDGNEITFDDVAISSWYATYVHSVLKTSVMSGYKNANGVPTGKYGPGDNVTIAQLAKVAHELADINEEKAQALPQNLRAHNQWFERYIASAEYLDWIVYRDKRIDPSRPATRGEVVATLLQALNVRRYWQQGNLFTDVKKNTPYASSIETAAEDGVISGYTNADGSFTGEFGPSNPVNRAEMAKIVDQAIKIYLDPAFVN